MGDVVGGHAVVIAQVPLSLVFYDGVVGSPADDGFEDDTLITEWPVWVVANGIAQEMTVASGVGEIVLAIVFVHP